MTADRLKPLLLAVLLLLAQALAALHELDLKAHADGHVCELCLALSAQGHGLPACLPQLLPVRYQPPAPSSALVPALRAAPAAPYRSRAPPVLLRS
ncbi:hypothetical protein JCM17961_16740 [Endothiovibrio diazotrophicus]